MGYFSNGTEGDDYEAQWCCHCVHQETCVIWYLHYMHNYEDCNNPESMLHVLIPRKDGVNGKCRMFYDKGLKTPVDPVSENG